MRDAINFRDGVNGTTVPGTGASYVDVPGRGGAGCARAGSGGARRIVAAATADGPSRAAASTSFAVTRPFVPLPCNVATSTPCSRARRRTAGDMRRKMSPAFPTPFPLRDAPFVAGGAAWVTAGADGASSP